MQGPLIGLTMAEARQRLADQGYNEVSATAPPLWLTFLGKLWAPVPWMLEITIILTVVLAHYLDAVIISFLLVFNAVISFLQEQRADAALALLRQRLAVSARVLRDGLWQLVPAREVVAGDILHIRMGDLIPADVSLLDGALVLDQSPLTGESVPVERAPGEVAYAGAIVKRGEASGRVVATGAHTYFGRTTELVKTAKTVSHLEALILSIVRYLLALDALLVVALLAFALAQRMALLPVLPFALMVLVASVPVALPATFTLTQALGAQELAQQRVLITRLSAIEEAAGMDILCTDKTGTITRNQLALGQTLAYPPFTTAEVVRLGALASEAASQDPIDAAILAAAADVPAEGAPIRLLHFTPFDPALKRTEATIQQGDAVVTVVKGSPRVVAALASGPSAAVVEGDVARLAAAGYRVLGVASGPQGELRLAGLLGLSDPPRPDSAALIADLRQLGVRTIMVTGDTAETARAVAAQVGIPPQVGDAGALHTHPERLDADDSIYAGVFPEDKYHLVRLLQAQGHVVGMTGDGVNDAPALKQAEVGVAVASATDVAKAAASIVLTTPGLLDVVAAVQASRRVVKRMHTYTLNKIVKTLQVALFLTGAFFVTRQFVITPTLVVLLLFANDFVTMAIATDHVTPSPQPEHWHVRAIFVSALLLAAILLVESFVVLGLAAGPLHQSLAQIQTLIFLMLVFSGQGTVYVVRETRPFWSSRPSRTLLVATGADIIAASSLAALGLLMAPVSLWSVLLVLAIAALFMLVLDAAKLTFRRLSQSASAGPVAGR